LGTSLGTSTLQASTLSPQTPNDLDIILGRQPYA